ncbi:MAG: hypothetical protein WAT58_13215 [Candidatus Dormiibacterota bacterium]
MKYLSLGAAALALALSGCGSSSTSTNTSPTPATGSSPTAAGSPSPTLPPNTVAINLTVTGSNVSPQDPSAKKGQNVQMTITTDKDEEVHLHGYDIHFSCKAGSPLTMNFVADKTGQFEIELEATSTHLTNFTVNP